MLQDYNVSVRHTLGKLNTVADYLSRNINVALTCGSCRKTMRIHSITATQAFDEKELYCNAVEKDEIIAQVLVWQATKP